MVALLGHNGSGKSTLAKHLNGLLVPDDGEVEISGLVTGSTSVSHMAGKVALLFQNPDNQICKRRVYDEVAFGPRNLGYSADRVDSLVHDSLTALELLSKEESNPHDLGYSERKRLALASVIAMDTDVLVLDEPTSALDSHEISLLVEVLQLCKTKGKTVIIISHDMDFIAEHFSRVICLQNGQKSFDGMMVDFFNESELLRDCGLLPPQIVRLNKHFNITTSSITPEDFIDEFIAGNK